MSFALLFSGQGTQNPRILRWLSLDSPLVQATNAALGGDGPLRRRRTGRAAGGQLPRDGASRRLPAALTPAGGLSVAIRNVPWWVVVGGPERALSEAATQLAALGARCNRLDIEVASHALSMREASSRFTKVLAMHSLHAPRIPLFSGTADRISGPGAAATALADQISTTLRWDDCLEDIHARHVACALEVGPGAALASMCNQRFPQTPARSADEFEHRHALVAWVRKQSASD